MSCNPPTEHPVLQIYRHSSYHLVTRSAAGDTDRQIVREIKIYIYITRDTETERQNERETETETERYI